MHRGESCIAEIMHSENSCIAKNHALRKIMHCDFEIYARREDFMTRQIYISREGFIPRWNLYIARRIYTSLKFVHHEKNPCLIEILQSREDFMPH